MAVKPGFVLWRRGDGTRVARDLRGLGGPESSHSSPGTAWAWARPLLRSPRKTWRAITTSCRQAPSWRALCNVSTLHQLILHCKPFEGVLEGTTLEASQNVYIESGMGYGILGIVLSARIMHVII